MLEMPSFPNRSEARQSPRQWPSGALSVSKTCWMCAEWMWWSLTVVILFGLDRVPIHLHAGILCFGEDFQTLNSKHSPFLGRNHVKCGQSSLIIIFGAMFRQTKHNTTQHNTSSISSFLPLWTSFAFWSRHPVGTRVDSQSAGCPY